MPTLKQIFFYSAIASTPLLTACGGDSSSSTKETDQGGQVSNEGPYASLDASDASNTAYLNLASGHTVTASEDWHFGYQKYQGFRVNGGNSGNGNIKACIAHSYNNLFDQDNEAVLSAFQALNKDNTLADFSAVDKTSFAENDLQLDSINTQIQQDQWLEASFAAGPVLSASTATSNGWIIRSATKNAADSHNYARVKVEQVNYLSSPSKRAIKLAVENWNTNTTSFDTAKISTEIDFTNSKQYWDMETNSLVTAEADWELSVTYTGSREWSIQVNGGVSGPGSAGVGLLSGSEINSAFDVSDPTDSQQVFTFFVDKASGAMAGPGNFGPLHYGAAGGHGMWPTYSIYLFQDADNNLWFKAQVLSNHGENDDLTSGNLYIRYEEIID